VASPLVATKLYIPAVRRSLVARPRLSERLSRGATSRLTLVSAPAGFGKTTLLSAWLAAPAAKERPVAWLSLEASDSQPAVFWTYVITALQTVVQAVGVDALPLLQSARSPIETVLTTLLNELDAVPNDIHLVLDDYHLVDGPDVEAGMVFLLEHLPPHVHLVISSRADPALPLARLRAGGELVEIRAVDLRFTLDEATDYLNEVAGLDLAADDITALEGRTEGWIAALQLAALSMQGRTDVAGFIAGFAGDDRYIVDYLVEEVLRRQPDDVRTFLIQTSILDRLSGPLCDAVTARPGGRAMLESLDRATCSWSHSTTTAAGTATTTSSPTCCGCICATKTATVPRTCTAGRACGTTRTASRSWRCATPYRPATSNTPRDWSSWPSRRCCAAGRNPSSGAGSTPFPTGWFGPGQCSPSA
jgi:LuxR family maltose regulon positive regulatory protein